jgi:hypothetical protein
MSAKPAGRTISIPAFTEVVSRDGQAGFVSTLDAVRDPQYRDQVPLGIRRKAEAVLEMRRAEMSAANPAPRIDGCDDDQGPNAWGGVYCAFALTGVGPGPEKAERFVQIVRMNEPRIPDQIAAEPMLTIRLRDGYALPDPEMLRCGEDTMNMDSSLGYGSFSAVYQVALAMVVDHQRHGGSLQ